MQRESLLWGPLWAENLYRWLNIKIIFDLDDALFINKINHNHTFKIDKAKRVVKNGRLVGEKFPKIKSWKFFW